MALLLVAGFAARQARGALRLSKGGIRLCTVRLSLRPLLGFGIRDLRFETFLLLLAPEKFCVGAGVDNGATVPDFDDLRRKLLDEVAIV